jgi:hypothetical protein
MYVQGLGVPQNLDTAMAWYRKAEQQYPDQVSELIRHLELRIAGTVTHSDVDVASLSSLINDDTVRNAVTLGAVDAEAAAGVTALPFTAIPRSGGGALTPEDTLTVAPAAVSTVEFRVAPAAPAPPSNSKGEKSA